jgi:hypothetical protein
LIREMTAAHPLVVARAADDLEGLAEGPAALDDRLAAVAGNDLADSLAGIAELPHPLSVNVLIGQRPGCAAEQADSWPVRLAAAL